MSKSDKPSVDQTELVKDWDQRDAYRAAASR